VTLIESVGLLRLRERFDRPPASSPGSSTGMRGHNPRHRTVSFFLAPRPPLPKPPSVMSGRGVAHPLDAAMGSVAQSELDERRSDATAEPHVNYTRVASLHGSTVVTTGTIVNRGLHIVTADGRNAEEGLVAHGTTACIVLEAP